MLTLTTSARTRPALPRLLALAIVLWFSVLAVHSPVHDILDDVARGAQAAVASGTYHERAASLAARVESVQAGVPVASSECAICHWLSGSPASPPAPGTPVLLAAQAVRFDPQAPRAPPAPDFDHYRTRAPPFSKA